MDIEGEVCVCVLREGEGCVDAEGMRVIGLDGMGDARAAAGGAEEGCSDADFRVCG